MKRIMWSVILILLVGAGIFVWRDNSKPEPPASISLINPLGPAVIPVTGITSGLVKGDVSIEVQYWKDIDEAVALLASNNADFAVLPITNAANIYSRGIDIVMLGVHEWKVFYLVAAGDNSFEGWQSLKGKQVYTAHGRGQTADVLMRSALSKEGINPDEDVKILYAPPQEIVALCKAGKVDFAALPEPFATLAVSGEAGKIVLDFQQYWGESTGKTERLPIAGLFVTREFINQYPQETNQVAQVLADSTRWSNENVDQALEEASKILPLPQAVMKNALKRIDFYYVPAAEAEGEVSFFLEKMQELYPQGTPKLPDQGFYTP